jgi:FKBP12-rapamycin complex-associated protein
MLDLVEHMERIKSPLPISHATLADYCFRLQAYAKALHHRELQFYRDTTSSTTMEALVDINAMLRQHDAALGTLNLASQEYDVRNPEIWYEKLGQWEEAFQQYEAMGKHGAHSEESILGRLRCLRALGRWELVANLTAQVWPYCNKRLRSQLAPLGAAGAWHMEAWSSLDMYCSAMDPSVGDRPFYDAVSCIHQDKLSEALMNIAEARDLLDPELTSFLDESPDRLDRYLHWTNNFRY